MIKTIDNHLPPLALSDLKNYISENEFQEQKVDDRIFSVMPLPRYLLEFFQIKGQELILAFLRRSNLNYDVTLNIHSDGLVNGRKTSLASVLYLNNDLETGTQFYKHHIHGLKLPDDVSENEFNRLLIEDSNNISKWTKMDYVAGVENRLVVYDASAFHSKSPQIINGERIVAVFFYSEKNKI